MDDVGFGDDVDDVGFVGDVGGCNEDDELLLEHGIK